MPKPPSLLLSSYTTLPTFYPNPTQTASPRTSYPHRRPHLSLQRRSYAELVSNPPQSEEPDLSWPEPVPPHKNPTPYQILSCGKTEPYTKRRFYSLVKLYHPDQCHPQSPAYHIPHHVRIERYRLLIAAHTILSDPAKRSAYDLWGHGWAGHSRPRGQSDAQAYEAYQQDQWPDGHNPMYNATWEDWERWHYRQNQNSQNNSNQDARTVYMSNFGFMSLIFMIVSVGGIVQGTRANSFSNTVLEHADRKHREASIELGRSKRATMTAGDRNQRIEMFLRHREAVNNGEEALQRVLPEPEKCGIDEISQEEVIER
ncbi:hypothetical protein GQ43DRAFT_441022 [Delitschia confertaspora ATCC 74209]|uniref:J domain-containing protein n=1 Tax=Delitschia confertaspora ATCC 74209 TaxID=1513339 RepID=A0A9P4JPZ4_9PLEO|nr:hypothetical protein GQ43DRAFT_441022 [Delitschia confertaspora ATCC 74209]